MDFRVDFLVFRNVDIPSPTPIITGHLPLPEPLHPCGYLRQGGKVRQGTGESDGNNGFLLQTNEIQFKVKKHIKTIPLPFVLTGQQNTLGDWAGEGRIMGMKNDACYEELLPPSPIPIITGHLPLPLRER